MCTIQSSAFKKANLHIFLHIYDTYKLVKQYVHELNTVKLATPTVGGERNINKCLTRSEIF